VAIVLAASVEADEVAGTVEALGGEGLAVAVRRSKVPADGVGPTRGSGDNLAQPYPDGRASDGYTICAMWLASRATRLGFTSDARFFKSYLRALEAQPRLEDPDLMVVRE
jgi:hypothetical protein